MTPLEVDTVGSRGETALHIAAYHGNLRVCGLLIQAGARLDATTDEGYTALMLAQADDAPLLELLSGNWTGPLPGTACERCAAVPDSALMHCSGCYAVSYCCPRCAAADWPSHAAYCKERRKAIAGEA